MNDSHPETDEQCDFPVLLPRSIFDDHVQVVGTSRGGKTALFVATQVIEVIRQKASGVQVVDLNRDLNRGQTQFRPEGS